MTTALRYSSKKKKKINLLLQEFDVMVGWYGVIRYEGETAVLEDIIVYPQTCTKFVCMADTRENTWFMYHTDPDVVRSLRYHGCSYADFPAVPSQSSLEFEGAIAEGLRDGEEYFFDITNKGGAHSVRCYTNKCFDSVRSLLFDEPSEHIDTEVFLKDARQKVGKASPWVHLWGWGVEEGQ